jgi:hypothetical protein
MGYVFATSRCGGCQRTFTYAPTKVPVIVVRGDRIPICAACVDRANELKRARGEAEFTIPEGAYEAQDETEVF